LHFVNSVVNKDRNALGWKLVGNPGFQLFFQLVCLVGCGLKRICYATLW